MRIAFLTSQFPGIRMGGIGSNTLILARCLADLPDHHDIHLFTFHLPPDLRASLPKNITFHAVPDLAARTTKLSATSGQWSDRMMHTSPIPSSFAGGGTTDHRPLTTDHLSALAAAAQSAGPAFHFLTQRALLADALLTQHTLTPFDLVEGPDYEALLLPLIWRLQTDNIPNPPATLTHIHSGSAINRRGNNLLTTPDDLAIDALEQAAIMLPTAACSTTAAVARESRISFPLDRHIETTPLPIVTDPNAAPPNLGGGAQERSSVLFVGRLETLKGVDTLTLAATPFLTACPDASIEFVGPDTNTSPDPSNPNRSMRAWILRTLPESLHPRIHFTGELPPPAVAERIRASRFLCLPSRYENFSNVAAQALALARTAIVSDTTGLPDVMGDAGLTFPTANPAALAHTLTTLWQNPAQIVTLSQKAHHRAQTIFNPTKIAADRITFYEKVVATPAIENRKLKIENPLLTPLLTLAHTLTNIPLCSAPLTPGRRLLALLQKLSPNAPLTFALYGAGRHTDKLLAEKHLWESHGHRLSHLIDDHPRFTANPTHLSLPVLSPQAALTTPHHPPIILSTDTFEDQLWQKSAPLRTAHIPVHRLYTPTP